MKVGARVITVLLGLAVWGGPAKGAAQLPGALTGTVRDESGRPLSRALVTILGLNRSTLADGEGDFVFVNVPRGAHQIEASIIGYAPARARVTIAGAAGRADLVLEATPLTIPGVSVTGTAMSADASAVAQATTQVSGKELERGLSATVAQTLSLQPGIRVRYNGPAAATPIMRGLSGDRILMLRDGQRTSDLAGSAVDHATTIDPLMAQRIEVVRGPATLLYGNNALGGVVNVLSGDVPTNVPAKVEGLMALQSESAMPGAGGSLRANGPLTSSWAFTLRGGARSAGDVRIGDDPQLGATLVNTDSQSWNGSIGAGYVGTRSTGGASLGAYRFAYGLPVPPGAAPVRLEGERREVTGRGQRELGSSLFPSLRFDGTAQDYRHDELDDVGSVQMAFRLRTETVNLLVRQAAFGIFTEGAWGVSGLFKRYDNTGPAALTPPAESSSWGLFGLQEVAVGSGVRIQVGGRVDRIGIQSRATPKFGEGVGRSFRTFSGSAGVRVTPNESISAGVSVSRTFRAPTVEELFSGALHAGTGSVEYGTSTLPAEKGYGVEGVVQVRSPRWNGQFVAYGTRIDDFIHLVAQPDTMVGGAPVHVYRYARTNATLRGVEASLEWAARRDLAVGFSGDLVHAEQANGVPLSYMPAPRVGGFARWDDGTFSLGGSAYREAAQRRVGSAEESETPAHSIVLIDAGVRVTRGSVVHSLTFRGENLGDELHREATSRIKEFAPGPGRNLSLVYRLLF